VRVNKTATGRNRVYLLNSENLSHDLGDVKMAHLGRLSRIAGKKNLIGKAQYS